MDGLTDSELYSGMSRCPWIYGCGRLTVSVLKLKIF